VLHEESPVVSNEHPNARLRGSKPQDHAVKNTPDDRCVDIPSLQLGSALRLIEQSGQDLQADGQPPQVFMQAVIDALCNLSSHDALTGLSNRRNFTQAMDRELDRVARLGHVALLLMVDIDHFKRVNDTHGHMVGDEVIKQLADRLLECVRPMDTVARFGGEEFALVLPNCSYAYGELVAERVRQAIKSRPFRSVTGLSLSLTVSVGGAYAPQWIRSESAIWVERADRQLYRAKREGRNRVFLEETLGRPPVEYQPAFAMEPRRALIFALTSGKGGAGKTFVSLNTAAVLSRQGLKVLVLDADLGLTNAQSWLGLSGKASLYDVCSDKATLAQAVQRAPAGFDVVLAGAGLMEHSRLNTNVREQTSAALQTLLPHYDLIIQDSGAGISDVVMFSLSLADEVVLVTTPETALHTDVSFTLKLLAVQQGRRHAHVVINHTGPSTDGKAITAQMQRDAERTIPATSDGLLKLSHVCDIAHDSHINPAQHMPALLLDESSDSPTAQAIQVLAASMSGLVRRWQAIHPLAPVGVQP
jgi:diguanylate cyclase (GGDEF)-like protein